MAPPSVQKPSQIQLFTQVCTYTPEDSKSLCAQRAKFLFKFAEKEIFPISGFKLVEGPDKQIIPVLKFARTPMANCHAHTAHQIPTLSPLVGTEDYLDPIAEIGVNPAALMLYGATIAIGQNLPSNPTELPKTLATLGLRKGDILIWRDAKETILFHSTTLIDLTPSGWITNNKWGTLPVKIEPLQDVIQYSVDQVEDANRKRQDPETEFETYLNLRGIPEALFVDVRRPIEYPKK